MLFVVNVHENGEPGAWNSKLGGTRVCSSLVPPRGFEPPTYGLGNRCSILTELQGRLEFFEHQV